MVSVNDRLLDFQVAQQIKWIRYGNREAREALKILKRVDAQLTQALRDVDLENLRFTEARAVALKAQVTELINATHARLAPAISESARDATVVAAEAETAAFKRILPAGLDVTTPNLGVLQTAASLKPFNGAVLGDWVNQLRENDLKRTWSTILDGITSGTTTDDLIRTLNGTRSLGYKDGVREVTRRGTEALVRTSINHATNTGRQMVWEANSDIIKGVRWVATLDTRTSPVCRDRDGKVGPVSPDGDWTPPEGAARLDPPMARPPAHPNCRSTTVAVTKSWRELGFDMDEMPPGTRASMDGQVPGDLTYYDWLRRQSDDVQKDVLGDTRWRMWKEQGTTPDRFHNDKGRLLNLTDLRRRIKDDLERPTGPVRIIDSKKFDLTNFDTARESVTKAIRKPEDLFDLDPRDFGLDEWPRDGLTELGKTGWGWWMKIRSDVHMVVINSVKGGKPNRYITNLRKKLERQNLVTPPVPKPIKPPKKGPDLTREDFKRRLAEAEAARKKAMNEATPRAAGGDKVAISNSKVRPPRPKFSQSGAMGTWTTRNAERAFTEAWDNLPPWVLHEIREEVSEFVHAGAVRSKYRVIQRKVVMGNVRAKTWVHEMFHALDFRYRYAGVKNGFRSKHMPKDSLDWLTDDPKLNSLAQAARKEFADRNRKGRGTLTNGDGDYALGDWRTNYEGRLYACDRGTSSEYISMAAEYYFEGRLIGNAEAVRETMRVKQPAMLNLLDYIWNRVPS